MYLVLFKLRPGEYDDDFYALNDAIRTDAESIPGYGGKQTWESPDGDEVLVIYRWESLDALERFSTGPDHREAKRRWAEWYDAYEVTITEVVESYGSDSDATGA